MANTIVTKSLVDSILDYDKDTGIFIWKISPSNNIKSGSVAGGAATRGYINIRIKGKNCKAHRLAWLVVYGEIPNGHIDHINGITSDNRICNLRVANNSLNQQNLKFATKKNSTGFLGVSWCKRANKFRAQLKYAGKNKTIGFSDTAEGAYEIYIAAKRKHHKFGEI